MNVGLRERSLRGSLVEKFAWEKQVPRAQSPGHGNKSRTSAAKAVSSRRIYGTAEPVPFVQNVFNP
jgi:hypothetical protein